MSHSINSKRQKHGHSRFLLHDEPFSPKFQNHITSSFLNQNTSHKAQIHHFSFSFISTYQNFQKILQMAEPSKKRKGVLTSSTVIRTRSQGASKAQTTQIPPFISSPTLFSSEEQLIQYNSLFLSSFHYRP